MTTLALKYSPRRYLKPGLWLGALSILTWLAAVRCKVDLPALVDGFSGGTEKVLRFLQPDWSLLPDMLAPAGVTVLIAFLATPLAALIALLLGAMAASNLSPRWLRQTVRLALGFERALPEMILLLVLVAGYGLGVFPAVLALIIGSVGMFGKFFADAMEEIEPSVLDAVRTSGGSYTQVLRYAVIPQIMPTLIANTVFRFEINIRAATVLGGIAGQGIGYELYRSISQLEYGRAGAAIFTVAVLVFLAERLSDLARRRVAVAGGLK